MWHEYRYSVCHWCEELWNISARQKLKCGIYICPVCEEKKGMTEEMALKLKPKKGD